MINNSIDNPLGCQDRFSFDLNDSRIWNMNEFIKFLVDSQGRVIDVEIPEGVALDSIGIYDMLDLFKFKSVTLRTFNIVQQPHHTYKLEVHPMAFRYFNVPPNTIIVSIIVGQDVRCLGHFTIDPPGHGLDCLLIYMLGIKIKPC